MCLCQSNVSQCASPHNPTAITAEEYFNPDFNLNGRDIGRPVELTSKVQRYTVATATPWTNIPGSVSYLDLDSKTKVSIRDALTLILVLDYQAKIEI